MVAALNGRNKAIMFITQRLVDFNPLAIVIAINYRIRYLNSQVQGDE
jgi:hypothetical protein